MAPSTDFAVSDRPISGAPQTEPEKYNVPLLRFQPFCGTGRLAPYRFYVNTRRGDLMNGGWP